MGSKSTGFITHRHKFLQKESSSSGLATSAVRDVKGTTFLYSGIETAPGHTDEDTVAVVWCAHELVWVCLCEHVTPDAVSRADIKWWRGVRLSNLGFTEFNHFRSFESNVLLFTVLLFQTFEI